MINRLRNAFAAFHTTLYAQMLKWLMLGLMLAVGIYFGANAAGSLYIENVYMSDARVSARKAEICSEFSQYVTINAVSGDDTNAIAVWSSRHPYATVLIFKGLHLRVRVNGERTDPNYNSAMQAAEIGSVYNTSYGRLYTVNFADGVYRIAIEENSQAQKETLAEVIAVAAAFSILLLTMLAFTRRTIRRVHELSKETAAVGAGDLTREVGTNGSDEIATLGNEIDRMRRSVLQQMESEKAAWQANSDLITSISHDIRTPMTSMIGYLDLLESCDPDDTENIRRFTEAARRKGMDLKDMTDEMFRYFLIFGKTDAKPDLQEYDGEALMGQLLSEAQFDLSESGFTIDARWEIGACTVAADVQGLKRVLDNLVSNIRKYADIMKPVTVASVLDGEAVRISVANSIASDGAKKESTKIGLRSCTRMMELMGGSFAVRSEDGLFTAELTLPAKPQPEALQQ